jgi:hypothetical protein
MMTFKQWLVYSCRNPSPASNQNRITNSNLLGSSTQNQKIVNSLIIQGFSIGAD